jgi:hypothetical protein
VSDVTYLSSDDLKETLEISGETYADDDINRALEAASRVIDAYKDTRFYPSYETRQYTAPNTNPGRGGCYQSLPIYDLNASTAVVVSVDMDGDGVYETTWTADTDFYFEPRNNDLTGKPWNQITLRQQAGQIWPSWQYGVQVEGSFGWSTAPGQVTEACSILAARYLKRSRETPYGIVTIGTDAVAMARLGKIDPDVAFMLDQIYDDDTPLLIL